jgi:hypothetical protein
MVDGEVEAGSAESEGIERAPPDALRRLRKYLTEVDAGEEILDVDPAEEAIDIHLVEQRVQVDPLKDRLHVDLSDDCVEGNRAE